jgi:outer membrane receptor protein involved in Fe transport
MNLGGRYEDFGTSLGSSVNTSKDINETEWAWNTGLAYIFSPQSKLYARAYQAYRFPRVDEYMVLSTGTINQDLKHEKSKGYEAGARFVGMNKRLSTNARYFIFDVDDQIVWNAVTIQNENLDETRHQGGELDIEVQANDLVSLFGGLGFTDAKFTAGTNKDKKVPLVPGFKSNLGFILNFDFGLTYRCQWNYLGKRYAGGDNSNQYTKLGSAETVDMYLAYTFKKVEFFVNAKNVFSEKYYNGYNYGPGFESFHPMPEAVVYGGVRVLDF